MKLLPDRDRHPDRTPPRRRFLKEAAALLAVAASPPAAASANPHSRPIGRHPESLPVVGMGTWRTFDVGPSDPRVSDLSEVLKVFVEAGGTLVDSSPMYGRSEAMLGTLARRLDLTDRLFYATKVWTEGETEGQRQMDTSAKYFHRKAIDLMQVHNLLDLSTQLATIRRRQAQGRVRYAGASHYLSSAHQDLADLIQREPIDFIQVNYSVLAREAENRLLPLAADRGVAVIINRPFQEGRLFRRVSGKPLPDWAADFDAESWAELFLKFIIGHPAVTVVIPATSNPQHMRQNMRAAHSAIIQGSARQRLADRLLAAIGE